MAYLFRIQTIPFYAATLPEWLSKGIASFLANGLPNSYQPGSFSVTFNALAVQSPSGYGGDFATSGTYQDLFNIYVTAQDTTDGVVSVDCLDPSINAYITIKTRMKPPIQIAGGAAIPNFTVNFYSAFIDDTTRSTYYGGDPYPTTGDPPYIPGDPVPTPTPGTFGWNVGIWNTEQWNRGA